MAYRSLLCDESHMKSCFVYMQGVPHSEQPHGPQMCRSHGQVGDSVESSASSTTCDIFSFIRMCFNPFSEVDVYSHCSHLNARTVEFCFGTAVFSAALGFAHRHQDLHLPAHHCIVLQVCFIWQILILWFWLTLTSYAYQEYFDIEFLFRHCPFDHVPLISRLLHCPTECSPILEAPNKQTINQI